MKSSAGIMDVSHYTDYTLYILYIITIKKFLLV